MASRRLENWRAGVLCETVGIMGSVHLLLALVAARVVNVPTLPATAVKQLEDLMILNFSI